MVTTNTKHAEGSSVGQAIPNLNIIGRLMYSYYLYISVSSFIVNEDANQ